MIWTCLALAELHTVEYKRQRVDTVQTVRAATTHYVWGSHETRDDQENTDYRNREQMVSGGRVRQGDGGRKIFRKSLRLFPFLSDNNFAIILHKRGLYSAAEIAFAGSAV